MSDYLSRALIYVLWCPDCQSTQEIETVVDQWLNGVALNGHYECAGCGRNCGVWMDAGMLDLDELRTDATTDSSGFEVWA